MRRRLIAWAVVGAVVAYLLPLGPAAAQESITSKTGEPDATRQTPVETLIKRGITIFTNEDMTAALDIFKSLIERDQEDPRGYFFTAAVYSVTMQDYKTRAFEHEFNRYITLAIDKAETRVQTNGQDAEAHFYLGGAYGYRGIDKTMVGSWLGAFLDGTRGVFHLQQALSFNPSFYDAYYGLGAYHYWVSAKSSILWFLPFFADERDRGIEEVRLASAKGEFSLYEAQASLVTVLMNEGRWEEALQEAEALLKRFPQDLSSHIQKGLILVELARWEEVEREFTWIKEFLATRPFHGYMRRLQVDYYLALADHRRGRSREFFEGCIRVKELMGRKGNRRYIEGLADLERRAQELCGAPTPPASQE